MKRTLRSKLGTMLCAKYWKHRKSKYIRVEADELSIILTHYDEMLSSLVHMSNIHSALKEPGRNRNILIYLIEGYLERFLTTKVKKEFDNPQIEDSILQALWTPGKK